jgi:murein hydrolase activator
MVILRAVNVQRILIRVFAAALLMVAWATAATAGEGTILVSDLNVRSGPNQREKVLFRLARQAEIHVLRREEGWLKIEYQGRRGYILADPRFVALHAAGEPLSNGNGDVASGGSEIQLKQLQRNAETLQERLKRSQTRLNEISGQEKEILDELNGAEQSLNDTRSRMRAARKEFEALQQKVAAMEERHKRLEIEIQESQDYMAQRLVALYKLGWMGGRIQLLASASSFYDFIVRKNDLERILNEDETILEKLRSDQSALEALLDQLNAGKAEKQAAQVSLDRRADQLRVEMARRSVLLDTVRSRKELERAALLALRQSAEELDGVIGRLEKEPRRSTTASASALHDVFEKSKGLLQWPVKGKIVSFFGTYRDEKTNLENFQSGIDIKAERGEPVRAVAGGYAIYANWFKGFGNIIIIDHGNHYYTVYAHLEEVFKVKGDRVEKDEVIATVGDSGSLKGPALRFEVRHRGKPVDPMLWINKG